MSCCLHECHLGWTLDGPEGVYEGSERARHRPRLQHGGHVRLVQPGVGELGAIVPQQSSWKRIRLERTFATRCRGGPGFGKESLSCFGFLLRLRRTWGCSPFPNQTRQQKCKGWIKHCISTTYKEKYLDQSIHLNLSKYAFFSLKTQTLQRLCLSK